MPSDSTPLPIAPNSDEIGTALLELEQTIAVPDSTNQSPIRLEQPK